MHIVIMGCGRVGAALAGQLAEHGHSVAVLDQNSEAFRRLPAEFDGRRVTGLGFDRDALAQAGIEEAYAFVAVSNGDNSNILAARVARETFGVENVVARIYDPRRAEVYQRLGIPTVGTVRWTADQVLRQIMPMGAMAEYRDASGEVSLVRTDLNRNWIGSPLRRVEDACDARVGYLTRMGRGVVAGPELVVQEHDVLHMLVATDRVDAVQRVLADPPSEEE